MKELHILKHRGKKYYIDKRLNQSRSEDNPHEYAELPKAGMFLLLKAIEEQKEMKGGE